MSILSLVLTIIFIVVCVLLILMVAIQDEKEAGLAGIFGGRSGSAFGAETASVVVKITKWLAVVFFALALVLAYINTRATRTDSVLETYSQSVEQSGAEESPASN